MPNFSPSPFPLKWTFSLYLVTLSSLGLACGSWVGFWLDSQWFVVCFDGPIGFLVVWFVLWWGFVGPINFRFCFSFFGWWWWCGCGFEFVIWLWFCWLGVVVTVVVVVVAIFLLSFFFSPVCYFLSPSPSCPAFLFILSCSPLSGWLVVVRLGFDQINSGLIIFMVVWYVLQWGFVGLIDFRFCLYFSGWWQWWGFGFVIWLWFWWSRVVVLAGGDGWMGFVPTVLWSFFFFFFSVVEWVLWWLVAVFILWWLGAFVHLIPFLWVIMPQSGETILFIVSSPFLSEMTYPWVLWVCWSVGNLVKPNQIQILCCFPLAAQ